MYFDTFGEFTGSNGTRYLVELNYCPEATQTGVRSWRCDTRCDVCAGRPTWWSVSQVMAGAPDGRQVSDDFDTHGEAMHHARELARNSFPVIRH